MVVSVGSRQVSDTEDFLDAILASPAGSSVRIDYLDTNNQQQVVNVTLSGYPSGNYPPEVVDL